MLNIANRNRLLFAFAFFLVGLRASNARAVPTFTTLVSFNGANGSLPQARLTVDGSGNLYGTTGMGGVSPGSYGVVFELSGPSHTNFTTVAKFHGSDGATPLAPISIDAHGALLGTASTGGSANLGTVFHLVGAGHGRIKTLVTFTGANGSTPESGLTSDSSGNLYGTTYTGGSGSGIYGTIFEVLGRTHKRLVTLHAFSGTDGAFPATPLLADSSGNLFGTAFEGGAQNLGVVYELSGSDHKTYSIIASFDGVDGGYPEAGLVMDASGNLYGTTSDMAKHNGGTIYELSGPDHKTLTTLYSFGFGHHSGLNSIGGLLIDAAGNLYGTTAADGGGSGGTVYKLSADHKKLTVLHAFSGGSGGLEPLTGLTADLAGNLYGTTIAGGTSNLGTVFELSGTGFVTQNSEIGHRLVE